MSSDLTTDKGVETPPIDGEYPALALEVRRLLKWNNAKERLSVRVAARKTGLSHATIANMARGDRPSLGLVIKFAEGMDANVNSLLAAAEYPPLFLRNEDDQITEDFFDARRFTLSATAQKNLDPKNLKKSVAPEYMAHYLSQMSQNTYKTEVTRSLGPFTRGEVKGYETQIISEYMIALKQGEETVIALDDKYRLLFELCIAYNKELFEVSLNEDDPEFARSTGASRDAYDRVVMAENSNAFALIGWYEQRNDSQGHLPSLHDFADLFSPDVNINQPRKDFLPILGNLKAVTNLWERQDSIGLYYDVFINGLRKNDVDIQITALSLLGFHILLEKEQDSSQVSSDFMLKKYAVSILNEISRLVNKLGHGSTTPYR